MAGQQNAQPVRLFFAKGGKAKRHAAAKLPFLFGKGFNFQDRSGGGAVIVVGSTMTAISPERERRQHNRQFRADTMSRDQELRLQCDWAMKITEAAA